MFRTEKLFWDIVMVDTCLCTFVQIHRLYDTKSELKLKDGLCAMTVCQSGFIDFKDILVW